MKPIRATCVTMLAFLTLAGAAGAKTLTVSGRLDHRGYTIVALGYNGDVATSRKQSFTLKVPDGRFTLQLITSKGLYGGPVVVAYKGKSALEGITRSVKLGTVRVLVSAGYARPAHLLPLKDVDTHRRAGTQEAGAAR